MCHMKMEREETIQTDVWWGKHKEDLTCDRMQRFQTHGEKVEQKYQTGKRQPATPAIKTMFVQGVHKSSLKNFQ